MTDDEKFQALLASTGLKAWSSFVPESASLPALAWVHINGKPFRKIQGSASGWEDSWRVTVVANNTDERKATLETLRALDNTRQGGYHRIRVDAERLDALSPGESQRRAFIDLTTIEGL